MLEVVDDKQKPLLREPVERSDRFDDRVHDPRRVAERRERHPEDPVGVAVSLRSCGLKREPRLPRAARAGQRQQTHLVATEQAEDVTKLALAAEEGCRLPR